MHDLAWRRSSFSGTGGGDCAELALLPDGGIALRDSKHPDAGHLAFTRAELRAFLAGARAGEFDDLAEPLR